MHLDDPASTKRLEIEVAAPLATRSERRAITDLLLEVTSSGADVEALLSLPSGREGAKARRGLFKARLILVSDGRLHTEARGSCGAWQGDISICEMDCDGGSFALRRAGAGNVTSVSLVVGALPGGGESSARSGFAVAACRLDAEYEVRVVPKDGKGLVEIGFRSSPASD